MPAALALSLRACLSYRQDGVAAIGGRSLEPGTDFFRSCQIHARESVCGHVLELNKTYHRQSRVLGDPSIHGRVVVGIREQRLGEPPTTIFAALYRYLQYSIAIHRDEVVLWLVRPVLD